jgi:hypothetical protein
MTVSTRIAVSAAAVVTLGVTSTVPALAAPPREPETRTVPQSFGSSGSVGSVAALGYAVPLAVLDGRCLAQYLADHRAGDRRLG